MENSEEVKKRILDLLENFGLDEKGYTDLIEVLHGNMLNLLQCLLTLDNKNKENIGTTIAKIIGLDGCDYQIQLTLVAKENEWQDSEGYFTTGKIFTKKSIDEIN
jgi:hypothetical protein